MFKGCEQGVHKYEPRYDKSPATADFKGQMTPMRLEMIEKYRQVTYVRDICVRCGKTVER